MTELEKRLGYTFIDKGLLQNALTHSSYANENKNVSGGSNERLEFLGDSVLGFTVADYLYKNCPDMPEGKMTRLRAERVCEQSLVCAAEKLSLGRYLRLGKGEKTSGGGQRPSIQADAVEAVIAAIYLDGGLEPAQKLIQRLILTGVEEGRSVANTDYKSALQELVQRETGRTLVYELIGERGPDHSKVFTARVVIDGIEAGRGDGRSKKEAEQAAAKRAVEALGNEA